MAARVNLMALAVWILSGCAVYQTPEVKRIALLAPFEGRYREVGYQALYAARMAIAETDRIDLELLAVDDGGSVETAIDRARALNNDPQVETVLVLGVHAAEERVLDEMEPLSIVVGQWRPPVTAIDGDITPPTELTDIAQLDTQFTCGDMCLLESFVLLADDPTLVTIETRSPPVDESFRERYINFDLYVPEPLPFAALTYQATRQMIDFIDGDTSESSDAEFYQYRYTPDGELTTVTP